jgi:homoserine dehydrogenase
MRGFLFRPSQVESVVGKTVAIASELVESKPAVPEVRRRTIVIGVLGCGTVGGGVVDRLLTDGQILGSPVRLGRVLVRNLRKPHFPEAVEPYLTTNPGEVVDDPEIDIVVEAIGGKTVARELVERALRNGKHVVSANKALIAASAGRLAALAREQHAAFRYEAAVGGAVPVVRAISDILIAERIEEIAGVMNGTSNYIMKRMAAGADFDDALADAQAAGYAEPDPTNDVEGIDAAQKIAVLSLLGFRSTLQADRIERRSLRSLAAEDFAFAERLGYGLVPLTLARRTGERLAALVSPAYVAADHDFARAQGPGNVFRVAGAHSGPLTFLGTGAGSRATASAVLADLADICGRLARWEHQRSDELDHPVAMPLAPSLPLLARVAPGSAQAVAEALAAAGVPASAPADDAVLTAPQRLERFENAVRKASVGHLVRSVFPLYEGHRPE